MCLCLARRDPKGDICKAEMRLFWWHCDLSKAKGPSQLHHSRGQGTGSPLACEANGDVQPHARGSLVPVELEITFGVTRTLLSPGPLSLSHVCTEVCPSSAGAGGSTQRGSALRACPCSLRASHRPRCEQDKRDKGLFLRDWLSPQPGRVRSGTEMVKKITFGTTKGLCTALGGVTGVSPVWLHTLLRVMCCALPRVTWHHWELHVLELSPSRGWSLY